MSKNLCQASMRGRSESNASRLESFSTASEMDVGVNLGVNLIANNL